MKTREERFEEDYKPWVSEHKKYPNPKSKDKTEKSLGKWRYRQRNRKFKLLIDFDKEANFGSSKSPKSLEERFKEEYIPWVLEHRKYPSSTSDDKIEKSLGQWRAICRYKKFKLLLDFDKKKFNFISRRSYKSREERLEEEYVPWVLEHRKYPSSTSKDETERSLGQWRSDQKAKNFKSLLDFEKKVNFNKSHKSPEERFIENYIPWVLKYKKYPSPHSDDKIERSLGQWRCKQKIRNFEQLINFDIFYSNYLIGNKKAIEIFNKLKEKGII